MYSFNFDFIFNAVYNILLAIRYAILFWILRMNPADYLEDHKFDPWDGLRDRGWIKIPENGSDVGGMINEHASTIYLGSTNTDTSLSWWDIFKDKVFGIKPDLPTTLLSGDSTGYGLNPNDVNYALDKVNNEPWFSNLHFSIQNPILALFADILSVATFFLLLIFIYIVFNWSLIALAPAFKKKEKKEDGIKKEKKETIKEISLVQEKIVEDNSSVSMPGGILNLPIDESALSLQELEEIKEKEEELENDLLLNYKSKNTIPKKENTHIKIKSSFEADLNLEDRQKYEKVEKELKEKEIEKANSYKEKWNIVLNYMEGKEEALWRIGILEADNLLFDILTDKGYTGLTIADKLRSASFNTIDLAWSAHKIRNRIAHHGSKFVLSERIARNTLELYRSIFTEFKMFE